MKLIFILSCVLIICAISVHSEELEASVGETNKFEEAPENDEEVDINWFELQHETIEQQADQPTSGEQFIAIRIGAAGNKDQVNPNLEGLVRIATQFLPNTYTFINVESASREVVAGIKYELLINALDENKSEVLCEIRILEQPWIITSENEKLRTLMYSNCSTDGPYSNEPRGKDVQHSINPIFNNEDKVMTEARLKDMESLIIIPTGNKTPKPPQAALPERLEASVPQPKEDEDGITVVTLSKGTSTFLDDFFSVGKIENKPVQGSVIENEVIPKVEAPARIEATPNRGDSENTFYQVAPNQNVEQPATSSPETSSQASAIQVTNNEIPLNREVLQVTCAKIQTIEETSEIKPVSDKPLETRDGNIESSNLNVNVERQKRATDGIDPMVPEKRLLKKLLNAALARLDRYDEDDNKRIILSVLASSVRGKLFTMDVRVADTKCSESTISAKYCKSQIIDDSIKVCRFEIENLDNGDIKLKKSECVPDNREKRQLAGGARPANEAEHQLVLEFLNEALATGDKQGYSLERVIDATVQTVAGKLYKVKAEFTVDGSTKVCNVEIWDRPWLGKAAREVTFECDTPARRKRQTLGGVSAISHSEVQPILNEVLSEGDYQSYRLIRIIEASRQIVSGIKYIIKAEFSIDQSTKICDVKILEPPGKSAARQVTFNCDNLSRRRRQIVGGINPTSKSDQSEIEGLLNEVLAEGDYKSYRLVRIIESTVKITSGSIYEIKAEFLIDQSSKICNVKIWDRPWLGKSGRNVEFNCDGSSRRKRHIQGGLSIKVIEKMIDKEFLKYIEFVLNDILQRCEYQSYKLIRIIDSSGEVMAGYLYRIKAEFSVNDLLKICNIKIWEKESDQGHEVQEFICQDQKIENVSSISLISEDRDPDFEYILDNASIQNDISNEAVSQESKQIESLLNTALTNSAYKSYKLVRIFDLKKDKPTLGFHVVQAQFTLKGVEHICQVKFQEISKQQTDIQEFKCNRKSVVRGGFNPTTDDDKPKVEKLLKEVFAYDDYKSYKLVNILQSWRQVAFGVNYKVRAEVKLKGEPKICDIKILNMFTKRGKRVVQLVCQDVSSAVSNRISPIPRDEISDVESIVSSILLQGNYQKYKLARIIEATKQIVAGILYRIKAEFVVDGVKKICNVTILEKISNEGREVQEFICDEPTAPLKAGSSRGSVSVILQTPPIPVLGGISSTLGNAKVTINKELASPVLAAGQGGSVNAGGISATSENEKSIIESILNEVLASGDYRSYRLLRIIESTKQIVAGILYRIKAEFAVDGAQKICNVKILEKVSNEAREVQEFVCDEPTVPLKAGVVSGVIQSPSIPALGAISPLLGNEKVTINNGIPSSVSTVGLAGSINANPQAPFVSVLGGIGATSENEKSIVESILNEVLASGDYRSYRLLRIIESTKQIVAGILYRIKAEFAVDSAQKICNVTILEKVSNEGREVQEFICDEPTVPLKAGSSAGVVSGVIQTPSIPALGAISSILGHEKVTINNGLPPLLNANPHAPSAGIVSGALQTPSKPALGAASAILGNEKVTINNGLPSPVSTVGLAGSVNANPQAPFVPVLGGISATSENEKSTIESILKEVLASGDYRSYRLLRIIESTKQIVAGILYRIKAEFAVDSAQKICNVTILEKVSNEGREVQEFICDEPTVPLKAGSSAGGVSGVIQTPSIPAVGAISSTLGHEKETINNGLPPLLNANPHAPSAGIISGALQTPSKPAVGGTSSTLGNEKVTINNGLPSPVSTVGLAGSISAHPHAPSAGIISGALQTPSKPAVGGTSSTLGNEKVTINNGLPPLLNANPHAPSAGIVSGALQTPSKPALGAASAILGNEKVTINNGLPSPVSTVGLAGSVNANPQAPFVPVLGGISATSENEKSTIESILKEVLASGDYRSYRLLRIIESTKQIVAGILYRIKAEFAVDSAQKICNVTILEKVSNEGREVQEFICDEPTVPLKAGSSAGGVSGVIQTPSIPAVGAISSTLGHEKETINNGLPPLLNANPHAPSAGIISGALQTPSKPAVGGTSSTLGIEKVTINIGLPSPVSTVGLAGSVNANPQAPFVPVLGGISSTSENEKSTIERILSEVLASGDYRSYRLLRIIESTKQIVAGILYRIKAEFAVDGAQKICNVKILEKVSNEGREVQEFICDEPTVPLKAGSSVGGVSGVIQSPSIPALGGTSSTLGNEKVTINNGLPSPVSTVGLAGSISAHAHAPSAGIISGALQTPSKPAVGGTSSTLGNEKVTINNGLPSPVSTVGLAGSINANPQAPFVPVLGGIGATSENEKSIVESILNEVLASGDYRSYRLLRIIESTKQIVAGILYRIKAEFAVDGAQKICNVTILEKVSNEGREIKEFICDEPTVPLKAGSPAGVVIGVIQTPSIPALGAISSILGHEKVTINNGLPPLLNANPHAPSAEIVSGALQTPSKPAVGGTSSTLGNEKVTINIGLPSPVSTVGLAGSVNANPQAPFVPVLGGISSTSENEKSTIERILSEVLTSGDYRSYRLLRIIESTKQIVAGILYRIKAEFAVDGAQKICNVTILEKVSNEGREVQEFICDEPTVPLKAGSPAGVVIGVIQTPSIPALGAISSILGHEKVTINNGLPPLLNANPHAPSAEIVSGALQTPSKPAVGGTSSTLGNEKVTINIGLPSPVSTVGLAGSVNANPQAPFVPVLGGISSTSENEKSTIERILSEVLTSGDYRSYRLLRIIESTKQIVAGILYRIKAEFAVDGAQKICNVKILEKVSNEGREVQEFICDEPTVPLKASSSVGGVIGVIQSPSIPALDGTSSTLGNEKVTINNGLPSPVSTVGLAGSISANPHAPSAGIISGALQTPSKPAVGGTISTLGNDKVTINNGLPSPVSTVGLAGSISVNPHAPSAGIVSGALQTPSKPALGAASAILGNEKVTINNGLPSPVSTVGLAGSISANPHAPSAGIISGALQTPSKPAVGGTSYTLGNEKVTINNGLPSPVSTVGLAGSISANPHAPSAGIVSGALQTPSKPALGAASAILGNEKVTINNGLPSPVSTVGLAGSVNANPQAPFVPVLGGISATSENEKSRIESILKEVLASGDYRSYRLLRIIESTKQIVAGILYRIKAEFAVDGAQKICNVKILEKVSNEGREVQEFMCDEPTVPLKAESSAGVVSGVTQTPSIPALGAISPLLGNEKVTINNGIPSSVSTVGLAGSINANPQAPFVPVLGGISATSENEKSRIESILKEVLASGDYRSYMLLRIIESTKQIVAGILYRIKAEFAVDGAQKICNVKILEKVSNEGREVQEFICDEPTVPLKAGSSAGGVIGVIQSPSIPALGGNSSTLGNEKVTINNGLPSPVPTVGLAGSISTNPHAPSAGIISGALQTPSKPAVGGTSSTLGNDKVTINNGLPSPVSTVGLVGSISANPHAPSAGIVSGVLQTPSKPALSAASAILGNEKVTINNGFPSSVSTVGLAGSISANPHAPSAGIVSGALQTPSKPALGAASAILGNEKVTINNGLPSPVSTVGLAGSISANPHAPSAGTISGALQTPSKPAVGGTSSTLGNEKVTINNGLPSPVSTVGLAGSISANPHAPSAGIVSGALQTPSKPALGAASAILGNEKVTINNGLSSPVPTVGLAGSISANPHAPSAGIVSGVLQTPSKPALSAASAILGNEKVTINNGLPSSVSTVGRVESITVNPHEPSLPVKGGISATSENEKSTVASILNVVLASGDYQSYRLLRIIESTKQIVAGILYRIKAEFAVDGAQKICNVKILENVSNEGREVQEFVCDESIVPLKAGVVSGVIQSPSITALGAINSILGNEKVTINDGLPSPVSTVEHAGSISVNPHAPSAGIVSGALQMPSKPAVGGTSSTLGNEKVTINNGLPSPASTVGIVGSIIGNAHEPSAGIVSGVLQTPSKPALGGTSSTLGNEKVTINIGLPSPVSTVGLAGSINANPQAPFVPVLGGISATSENEKSTIESILNEVLASGDYRSYRLLRIIESTKQIVAGILYRIKAEFAVDGAQKICNVKILEKVSNEGREVQEFICDEPTVPLKAESSAGVVSGVIQTPSIPALGAISPLLGNEKVTINNGISSSVFTVGLAGSINANPQAPSVPVLGGISATSENEKSTIESILNEVLASGDYRSYRLLRIIESTKQIVAGILYRIKAEFAVDGAQKICNVKILEKVSNEGREVQEFICDEPTVPLKAGSSAGVVIGVIQSPSIPALGDTSSTLGNEKVTINNGLPSPVSTVGLAGSISANPHAPSAGIISGALQTPSKPAVGGTISTLGNDKVPINNGLPSPVSTVGLVGSISVNPHAPSAGIVSGALQTPSKPALGAASAILGNEKVTINNGLPSPVSTVGLAGSISANPHAPSAGIISGALQTPSKPAVGGTSSTLGNEKVTINNGLPSPVSTVGLAGSISANPHAPSAGIVSSALQTPSKPALGAASAILGNEKVTINNGLPSPVSTVGLAGSISANPHAPSVGIISGALQTPSKPAVGGTSSTLGNEKVTINNGLPSPVSTVGHVESITVNPHEPSLPVKGGISATSENEKSIIKSILNEVLASGDYRSYRLLRIIESTKQIVAGILYRIKAEFAVDGAQKICNVKILEKISNERREVQEFICDEPTVPLKAGSSAGGIIGVIQSPSIPALGGTSSTLGHEKVTINNGLPSPVSTVGLAGSISANPHAPSAGIIIGALQTPSKPAVGGTISTLGNDKVTINNGLPSPVSTVGLAGSISVNPHAPSAGIVSGALQTPSKPALGAASAILGNEKVTISNGLPSPVSTVGLAGSISANPHAPSAGIISGALQTPSKPAVGGTSYTLGNEKVTINNGLPSPVSTVGFAGSISANPHASSAGIVSGALQTPSKPALGAASAILGNEKVTINNGLPSSVFTVGHVGSITVNPHEPSLPVKGGISATSENEKSIIKSILNEVLASGDYRSYRLLRIIESTKQIVAGILYRIKAEFAVDGAQKICNVKILEKVSNEGREVQEFVCDESIVPLKAGVVSGVIQSPSIPAVGAINSILGNEKVTINNGLPSPVSTVGHAGSIRVNPHAPSAGIVSGALQTPSKPAVGGTSSTLGNEKVTINNGLPSPASTVGLVGSIIGNPHAPSAGIVSGVLQTLSKPAVGGTSSTLGYEKVTINIGLPSLVSTVGLAGSVNANPQAPFVPVLGGISATSENEKSTIESILNEVLASGDYRSYRLLRIIESTKQIVAGILYRIKAEFAVDGAQKICNVTILEKVSNEGREIQEFICDEPTVPLKAGSSAGVVSGVIQSPSIPALGAISSILGHEKVTINNGLPSPASTVGLVGSIIGNPHAPSAGSASGVLQMPSKPAVDGTSSTLGNEKVTINIGLPSLVSTVGLAGSVNANPQAPFVPVLGGISATSEDENSTIESILNEVLASGDYRSYRLLRIIESTKQIVAGILYRIKAEFAVDGAQKICNVTILEKVSNEGREIQDFICDEPTVPLKAGSSAGVVSGVIQTPSIPALGAISSILGNEKVTINNGLPSPVSTVGHAGSISVNPHAPSAGIVSGVLQTPSKPAVGGTSSTLGNEKVTINIGLPSPISTVGLAGSINANPQAPFVPVLGGISATSENEKSIIESILNEVLASGDYRSYRLLRIIESTKQIVAGILYRIKAEFAVDGAQKICNVKILEKVSNEGREVQEFICEESTVPLKASSSAGVVSGVIQTPSIPALDAISSILGHEKVTINNGLPSPVSTVEHAGSVNANPQALFVPVYGGISATSDNEKHTIESILNKVLASGDYRSYKLLRIIESTKQIVAGILYRIKAEFAVDGVQKICNVKILEKVSNEGREVQEFICDMLAGDVHAGNHAGSITVLQSTLSVPGGVDMSGVESLNIVNILNEILVTNNYQSYKLVKVIESSKEVNEGIYYRIKAEFLVNGVDHVCDVNIWDRRSEHGQLGHEFKCSQKNSNGFNSLHLDETLQKEVGDKSKIESILNEVLSQGDFRTYRLVRIIESSTQVVSGILYRIKAEFTADGSSKICNVEIWDQPWLGKSARQVEFKCHDNSRTKRQMPGENLPTSDADRTKIESVLNEVLVTGDYNSYRLVKIIESSKQIVSGTLYKIKAEFSVDDLTKVCNVKIWDRPWLGNIAGRQIEFNCDSSRRKRQIPGGVNLTSDSAKIKIEDLLKESLAEGDYQSYRPVRTIQGPQQEEPSGQQTFVRQIKGGFKNIPMSEMNSVENLLSDVLSEGEYKSYRVVRIIEASKQVVAGLNYRIKAEFEVEGVSQICMVKIYLTLSDAKEIKDFTCEEHEDDSALLRQKRNDVIEIKRKGGRSRVSESDIPAVQSLLNSVLITGDYQSYRLLRIISATKQTVAGTLFRINAEFELDGVDKICDITIWRKIMDQGTEVTEFSCVQKRAIGRRSRDSSGSSSSSSDSSESSERSNKKKIRRVLDDVLTNDEYQIYSLVRIIQGSRQKLTSGTLYYIEAIFLVNGDEQQCTVNINERYRENRKVYFKCPQPTLDLPVRGGFTIVPVSDRVYVQNLLTETLSEGEYRSYRVVQIIEASRQVVAGSKYRIKAEFAVEEVDKICVIHIWVKLSNEKEITEFTCEETQAQPQSLHTTIVWRKKRQVGKERIIKGGRTNVPESDLPQVQSLLNSVLLTGDYQSYRLIRIISATRQTVAGRLYRVNAEFELDGMEKICDVTIWKKLMNEGTEVKEFSCVQKRAIGRRSRDSSGSSSSGSDSSESSERSNKKKIRRVLDDVLTDEDYHAYSLVRIIQGSRQKLTYGTLYYIEAIFLVNGDEQQCTVNINERYRGNRKVYFKCPQPTLVLPVRGGFTIVPITERPYIQDLLIEVLSEGEYQSYRVLRIIEASSQVVSGSKYRIKAEFAVADVEKICLIHIWVKLSNTKEITDFSCEEPEVQQQQHTAFLWRKTRDIPETTILGGITDLSESELPKVELLFNSAVLTGDYESYRLVRIIEATKQMVAGISYAIKAEFTVEGESRTCSLTIWDRPWLGKSARVVEFKECDGESVARAIRQAAPPGSQRSVNQEEYPKIEEMLNTALASGDRQNFRLARILHVTKQLSSGWTYKIRGAFEVDGVIKRCNIKLWNRPWLSNAATVESFKCDEHDEHTIRSNHDEKIKRTLDLYLHGNFSDNKIFEIYERLYNKNYPTALNRNMRLRIFKTNLRKIRDLNQNERGTATYGITEFADLTSTEYRMRTGLLRKTSHTNHISNPIAEIPNIALPREFDWRTRGAVSQVKNQGSCGSCWAFSVIGNIEGIHAIKTGVLEEYSEQELVDCDTLDQGCNGGLPDDAYKAIEQLGGLETEKDYPYTARRGHCSFNSTKVKTQIKGAVDLPKNETAIAQWLLQNGPVSIGINANAMQFYRGGVSHPWHVLCNKSDLDHGVLIVGFGVHDYPKFNKTLPYWTIKNSWGPRWGEQGYYRVYRGDNTCGVSEMVSSAVLE